MRASPTKSPHTLHTPVLLQETIAALELTPRNVVVDGTVGGGGHARAILEKLGAQGTYIGIDRDAVALERAFADVTTDATVHTIVGDFRNLTELLSGVGVAHIDRLLLDLGYSSDQLEQSGRGFSFQKDEPLLMTYEAEPQPDQLTAAMIVNEWDEEGLANVLYGYGEESRSRKIARAIVHARAEAPIVTSKQLAEIVEKAAPRRGKTHTATKTFQALRIAVNGELNAIETCLSQLPDLMKRGGRASIITFHSLEDRIVKHTFKNWHKEQKGTVVEPFPTSPSEAEEQENPRARSAKLRTFAFTT